MQPGAQVRETRKAANKAIPLFVKVNGMA